MPHQETPVEQQQQEGKGAEEQREPKHKKHKANKESNTLHIDEEDVATLTEALQESSQESLPDLDKQHNQFTTTITDRLNELGRTIKEIKIVVECAP